MTALRAAEDMTFSIGNGTVRVTLPAGYNGELDATTGSGDIRSDFDLKLQGRVILGASARPSAMAARAFA